MDSNYGRLWYSNSSYIISLKLSIFVSFRSVVSMIELDWMILFVAVFLGCTSTGRVGLWFLLFYVQEYPKAQPAVVLVLKRLRRRGNGLKSHPTEWEKPGIGPATPGLQDNQQTKGKTEVFTICNFNIFFNLLSSTFCFCLKLMLKYFLKHIEVSNGPTRRFESPVLSPNYSQKEISRQH